MPKSRPSFLKIVFAVSLISLGAFLWASASQANNASPLFGMPTSAAARSVTDSDWPAFVTRARAVTVDQSQLGQTARAVWWVEPTPRPSLTLNLFPDATFIAILDSYQVLENNGLLWTGHLENQPLSSVIFVAQGGQVTGHINAVETVYEVRYTSAGAHVIRQLDYSAYPPELEPLRPSPSSRSPAAPRGPLDDGSVIDVLVLYTASARNAVGGATAMQNLITLAMAETNQIYGNSGITQRLNLVGLAETVFAETDFNTALDKLTKPSDGSMDEAHTLRTSTAADMVALIINSPASCGLAWLMTNNSSSFESNAFSVTHYDCATGYYSFGHELGHNMGATHDRDNSGGPGLYSYSYGYKAPDKSFRTVMAYNCQGGCPRVPYFSNPNVTYNGQPTGIDQNAANSANNMLTLNNTALTIANFRQRPQPNTPTPTSIPTNTPTPTTPPANSPTPSPTPTSTPAPTDGPSPTPTVTPTGLWVKLFLPSIAQAPAPVVPRGIYGKVLLSGQNAANITINLILRNVGVGSSILLTTTTDTQGNYAFTSAPSLANNQIYYVRYLNRSFTNDHIYLWQTGGVPTYQAGAEVKVPTFDIADIPLVSPLGGSSPLPLTFQWQVRPNTPSDSYEFNLFNANRSLWFYTYPALGYVSSHTLNTLPTDFTFNQTYYWEMWVYSEDGGTGISLGTGEVTINSADQLRQAPSAPQDKRLPEIIRRLESSTP